jgi:excisionase family DNA binding protein
MRQPLPRLLYTVSEVATMTGLSTAYVYQLVASGALPSLRIGRSVRVASDRLTQWIEDQTKAGE